MSTFFKISNLLLLFIFSIIVSSAQCTISDVTAEVTVCENDEFDVVVDFEFSDVSDNFEIAGNGMNYGTFSYADVPVTLTGLSADCELEYEFVVRDEVDDDCQSFTELGVVCCGGDECMMSDITFGEVVCIGGPLIIINEFDFEHSGTGETFDLFIDDELHLSGFPYSSLGTLAFEFGCETVGAEFVVRVCDTEMEECCTDITIENPCPENCELCLIGNVEVTGSDCEDGLFSVEIDFLNENVGSSGFTVVGNGVNYGTFNYADLPITIDGLATDCDTEYEFVVTDVDNPECGADEFYGKQCCPEDCMLSNITIEVLDCDGDVFGIQVDFDFEFVPNSYFNYEIPGVGSGMILYTDLPAIIEGNDTGAEFYNIIIHANSNTGCAIEGEFTNPCFVEPECDMHTLDFTDQLECDNEIIVGTWLIDGDNTSEVGYDIYINGEFLFFIDYNESNLYEFEIADPGTETFTIRVCDNDNADCCIEFEVLNPCFEEMDECEISEVTAEVTACEDDLFDVEINFNYTGVGDNFEIVGNGVNYGTFSYADVPVTLTGLSADCELEYEFVVRDVEDNECLGDTELGVVCCGGDECNMSDITYGEALCIGGPLITISGFDFEHIGTGENFDLFIDGEIWEDNIPYSALGSYGFEFDCELVGEEFVIRVCDSEMEECCTEVTIENPCPEGCEISECVLSDLTISTSECDGTEFEVEVSFAYTGTTNDFYDYEVPGQLSGTAAFADLPLTFTINNTDIENFVIEINENDNPDCAIDGEFTNPCFEEEGECDMHTLDFTDQLECDNEIIVGTWLIDGDNTSEVGYDIYINGEFLFFIDYDESNLYEFEIADPGTETFTIRVCDNDNANCCIEFEVLNPCFEEMDECEISEVTAEVTACEDDLFDVEINFNYTGVGDNFEILGNGMNYGTFSYADVPVTLTGLSADCELEYEFVVRDVEDNECLGDTELGVVCCGGGECMMSDITYGEALCIGGPLITISGFDFEHIGTGENFDLFIDGEIWEDNIPYSALGSYGFEFDCELVGEEFVIRVCDSEMEECCTEVTIENPCPEGCEISECVLSDLTISTSECDGTEFEVEVSFAYTGTTNDFYDYEVSGQLSGTAAFADLPLTFSIDNTDIENFVIEINENDNPDCAIDGEFSNPCFEETEPCEISEVTAEVTACEDDVFDVEINFNYTGVGANFEIVGNGGSYGTFSYADVPVTLTGLSADCELEYEFVVRDVEDNDCQDDVEIGVVCCGDFNLISTIEINTQLEETTFMLTISVDQSALRDCDFELFVDGVQQGTLSWDDNEFVLGPFDCTDHRTIKLNIVNTCSESEYTEMIDLSKYACITGILEVDFMPEVRWDIISNQLYIVDYNNDDVNLDLFDMYGRKVSRNLHLDTYGKIDLSYLTTGVFLVVIEEKSSSQVYTQKIPVIR